MRDGKNNVWKEDCTNCLDEDKMIVVEDDGDDLLKQEHVCSECNYSAHHRHEWRTVKENYLNDAERKEVYRRIQTTYLKRLQKKIELAADTIFGKKWGYMFCTRRYKM